MRVFITLLLMSFDVLMIFFPEKRTLKCAKINIYIYLLKILIMIYFKGGLVIGQWYREYRVKRCKY